MHPTYTIHVESWAARRNHYNLTIANETLPTTALFNNLGKCCLGFICECSTELTNLLDIGMPDMLDAEVIKNLPEWLFDSNKNRSSQLAKTAVSINDNDNSIEVKMISLGKLFHYYNIRLRFVRHGWIVLYDNYLDN